jgi:hypothetical protein
MTLELPRCACGCGAVLVRTGKRGPGPAYASAACRKRAERRRRADAVELPTLVPAEPSMSARPVDAQVERALLEARAVGFALMRLGSQARPELAWRCTKLGEAIIAALGSTFGKETL